MSLRPAHSMPAKKGSGLRTSLPILGLGGGLTSLSASLATMPAARSHAVPSTEAASLLRSIGYYDTTPLALSSLYRQPGATPIEREAALEKKRIQFGNVHIRRYNADHDRVSGTSHVETMKGSDSKATTEEDAIPLEYEQMTALVAERLDRLSRLTTDNFVRAQSELDWEEERASLVGDELYSLHLSQLHGPAEGVESVRNPIAGFAQAPFGNGQRCSLGSDSERWDTNGRLHRLAKIVERINKDKWCPSPACQTGVQPLEEFASSIGDTTLDSRRSSQTPPVQSRKAQEAEEDVQQHWRYVAELYRILHSIVSPLVAANQAVEAMPPKTSLGKVELEELLVEGSLRHLHDQFREQILTIFETLERSSTRRNIQFDDDEEEQDLKLCDALQLHLDGLKVSQSHKSLWPKVLLLMRSGRARTGGKLLRQHVEQRNAREQAHAQRLTSHDSAHVQRCKCRNEWSDQIARALERWDHRSSVAAAPEGAKTQQQQQLAGAREAAELRWALNLYVMDEKMALATSKPQRYVDHVEYRMEAQRFREESDSKYTNAVLCLLNYEDDNNPGQIPRPEDADLQAEASRYECQLHEVPLLLGDAGANLLANLGMDAGLDRLSSKDAVLVRNRRADDARHKPEVQAWLASLQRTSTTSLIMQKALWRLVQDQVWRHLAFVRPAAAARQVACACTTTTTGKPGQPLLHHPHPHPHPKKQNCFFYSDMHPLSLEYCQTHGMSKMLDAIANTPGWSSFKLSVNSFLQSQSSAPQTTGLRAARGGSSHRTAHPTAHPPMDHQTKAIVAYNLIQMLLFTLQFGKAIALLSKLGVGQLLEAAHMAIGLHLHGIRVQLDELGDKGSQALLVSLISHLLDSELLVFSPEAPEPALQTHAPLSPQAKPLLTNKDQMRRAIHYCLLLQDSPRDAESALALPLNPGAVQLLAQLCLSAPALQVHEAYKDVVSQLCDDSPQGQARRALLRKLIWMARSRAGEVCVDKGQILLQDAALCFYWAERDQEEREEQVLNMQRYLATITKLLDIYAAPNRPSCRHTRAKVLQDCSILVKEMILALEGRQGQGRHQGTPSNPGKQQQESGGGKSLVARQARDLIRWLSCSRAKGADKAGVVSDSRDSLGAEGLGTGAGCEEGGTRRLTMLAVFLHTWQVASAHEVLEAGMPLDAVRELLHLPCHLASSRKTQFAPQVATLLRAFTCSPASSTSSRWLDDDQDDEVRKRKSLSMTAWTPTGKDSRPEAVAGGQVCFLPCWHHAVSAEHAVLQVEKIMSASQMGGGGLAVTHLVNDAIILSLQCFLSLKKKHAHMPEVARESAGSVGGDYSSQDVIGMLSPQVSLHKRRRPLEDEASASSGAGQHNVRRRSGWEPMADSYPTSSPHPPLFTPIARARSTNASSTNTAGDVSPVATALAAFGDGGAVSATKTGSIAGIPSMLAHDDVVVQQHKLLHSIDWHIEELRRFVERLVGRNLCPHDLSLHVQSLLQSSQESSNL